MSRTIVPGFLIPGFGGEPVPVDLAQYHETGTVVRVDLLRREVTIRLEPHAVTPAVGSEATVRFLDELEHADALNMARSSQPT